MTIRIHTILALLIAGSALVAVPALAADAVSGNRGPSDKPQNRDAPFTLPGRVAPRPTPKVDVATLSRGIFDDDQAGALANLGTVTFSADGSVTETPPSDALRGIFESTVKGHQSGK